MTRTAALQEIPRMNLEEAHGARRSRRLMQEQTVRLPGVCERAFAGSRKVESPVADTRGHEDFNALGSAVAETASRVGAETDAPVSHARTCRLIRHGNPRCNPRQKRIPAAGY